MMMFLNGVGFIDNVALGLFSTVGKSGSHKQGGGGRGSSDYERGSHCALRDPGFQDGGGGRASQTWVAILGRT